MTDVNEAIDQLAGADLRFYVSVPWVSGKREFYLSPEEVKEYMVDAPGLLARLCGVPREAYLGYHRDNYTAFCCGKTREGKACRNNVPEGTLLQEPREWLRLQGEYCTLHGG